MDIAIEEAKRALEQEEVPVGCALMKNGVCVKSAHNLTNRLRDPLAHAEVLALRAVEKKDLPHIDLFVTCEPCIMCLSIILKMQVRSVVYACKNIRFGGISVFPVQEVIKDKRTNIIYNETYKDASLELLKRFYTLENRRAPPEKRKCKKDRKKF